MKTSRIAQKTVVLFLLLSFLCREVVYAAPQELFGGALKPIEILSQDPSRFEAPLDFAILKEIHKGTGGPFIIHIQDAHSNLSGQQNLSSALKEIQSKY